MTKAYYQDTVWYDCVHIDAEEARVLSDFHWKKIEKLEKKLDHLKDKSEGSLKYYDQMQEIKNEIHYSKMSHDICCRILRDKG